MILFLDIDGPMIPARSFIFNHLASINQELDETCVKILLKIIEENDIQIVLNTTHNLHLEPDPSLGSPGLLNVFEEVGLAKYLHPSISTDYPHIYPRILAINKWLNDNPGHLNNWIAFDDAEIPHERAYLTSFDHGIGIGEFIHARKFNNERPDFKSLIMPNGY